MIELQKVTVIYNRGTLDEKVALRDIDLFVEEGQFVVIVGANGAGKSTLMKVIVGEVKPTFGVCRIMGRVLKEEKIFKCGSIVCQDPNLGIFPNLSIEENLMLARKKGFRGLTFGHVDSRALELLKSCELGLEENLKKKASKLSGGQKQALAMVMAVSSNPKLLLLDEHTASLDPKSTEKIMELTDRINKTLGTTILMITHDMNIAEQYGDTVIVMEDGRIITRIDKSKQKIQASQLKSMIKSRLTAAT